MERDTCLSFGLFVIGIIPPPFAHTTLMETSTRSSLRWFMPGTLADFPPVVRCHIVQSFDRKLCLTRSGSTSGSLQRTGFEAFI
jgi:hypothetical protein